MVNLKDTGILKVISELHHMNTTLKIVKIYILILQMILSSKIARIMESLRKETNCLITNFKSISINTLEE